MMPISISRVNDSTPNYLYEYGERENVEEVGSPRIRGTRKAVNRPNGLALGTTINDGRVDAYSPTFG